MGLTERLPRGWNAPPFVVLTLYQLLYATPLLVLVALLQLLSYVVWMRSLLPRLQPSDERLLLREMLREIMTSQARAYSAVVLWSLEFPRSRL